MISQSIAAKKKRTEAYRQRAAKIKVESGCKFCDEDDPVVLDFHHPYQDKEFAVSNALGEKAWEVILREIKKCIVVCANCHRRIHAGKLRVASSTG